ncbi:hypothetical protein [Sphingomonas sp. KC8]|uniref:hypothetical protein n=1 Tax=Sphingomonas sp. KC8 TaxID=1030157 RepID=UPI000248A41B|nr:hypothetical protein [Sphingomonas sp. KC8]ARS27642.1 hypothetical protein KC8_10090 [Sphingomonas sp. KC8]
MAKPALRRREGLRMAFKRLSRPKQLALGYISSAIPIHQTYLVRFGIKVATLRGLENDGYARLLFLSEKEAPHLPMPFWCMTQAGRDLMRAQNL